MPAIKQIAITCGEPAGVGPDIIARFAGQASEHQRIVFSDPGLLATRAKNLGINLTLKAFNPAQAPRSQQANELDYVPVALARPVVAGQPDPANAGYVLNSIKTAAQYAMAGKVDALVTGPVQKSVINDSGIAFSGHTEYLAELANRQQVVMMLACDTLRVALVTTHLPLKAVAQHITRDRLTQVIRVLHHDMRTRYHIDPPRIAVCGLNPHAGEDGHLGDEEIMIIEPIIRLLRNEGMQLSGPWSADTLFTPDRLDDYDVVLGMYHDQCLPVLKHIGFGNAVNITLGLPFIRTSVDHGTALALAGTAKASTGSLMMAFHEAVNMAQNRAGQEAACV